MASYDRYILGVTLFLMLAMSSADIDCKMKSGCSTQCDPIGWNNIEEHLFNKEFSITCRNIEDDKLREEIEGLKTSQKDLYIKIIEMELENRDLKDSFNTRKMKYNEDVETKLAEYKVNIDKTVSDLEKKVEMKFESKFAKYEAIMNKTVSNLEKKVASTNETVSDLKNEVDNMNKTILDLEYELNSVRWPRCHEVKPKNVKEKSGTGGVFDISYLNSQIEVVCDLTTDGGGWTVFQRRFDGSQSFNQDWKNYAEGFGNLTGEFWLGLEKMHVLTQTGQYELRIAMTDENSRVGIAKYQTFSISGSSDKYRLNIGGFSGTGVSDWLNYNNNMEFSTKDRDNDKSSDNCADTYGISGWWYKYCSDVELNSPYGEIHWYGFSSNIRKTEMKFRKK